MVAGAEVGFVVVNDVPLVCGVTLQQDVRNVTTGAGSGGLAPARPE